MESMQASSDWCCAHARRMRGSPLTLVCREGGLAWRHHLSHQHGVLSLQAALGRLHHSLPPHDAQRAVCALQVQLAEVCGEVGLVTAEAYWQVGLAAEVAVVAVKRDH
jgi:hypothetical protein